MVRNLNYTNVVGVSIYDKASMASRKSGVDGLVCLPPSPSMSRMKGNAEACGGIDASIYSGGPAGA